MKPKAISRLLNVPAHLISHAVYQFKLKAKGLNLGRPLLSNEVQRPQISELDNSTLNRNTDAEC